MPAGPVLIFDKSTLQSLNVDESVWLDNFFLSNITPLFFVETLADLEKEARKGKTPEEVVGALAYKTPDMASRPNIHHQSLMEGELVGAVAVDMRYGRPIIAGGRNVELEGKTGSIFQEAPELQALQRWQRNEYLEVERGYAKAWRDALSKINLETDYASFQTAFRGRERPKSLEEVKQFTESVIEGSAQEWVLKVGLKLVDIPSELRGVIIRRWINANRPPVRIFAPYFRYVLSVNLFFYLAIAADLIARTRPSHMIDIAYLYYLPFCMVFTSSDKLHQNVVPWFLGSHQSFVKGSDLKEDLKLLNIYYEVFPEEEKAQGILKLAPFPPSDTSFLVTRLWDKHMNPAWRSMGPKPMSQADKERQDAYAQYLLRLKEEAKTVDPQKARPSDSQDFMIIEQMVYPKKGKWIRFNPADKNSEKSKS